MYHVVSVGEEVDRYVIESSAILCTKNINISKSKELRVSAVCVKYAQAAEDGK